MGLVTITGGFISVLRASEQYLYDYYDDAAAYDIIIITYGDEVFFLFVR